ncbi:MAG: HD domain-containing protein [Nitrospirae bacterium]|nr:HD domain-containing protein [Nitrospirota bacterium]
MLLIEQKRTIDIDFQRFERLLHQIALLANVSVRIMSLKGKTLVSANGTSDALCCDKQATEPERCRAESFNLFRYIEKSGKPALKTCHENLVMAGIPLKCNQEIVAVLCSCMKSEEGDPVSGMAEFLDEIANRISSEIQGQYEADNITQELSDKYEELNLIYDFGRNLGKIVTNEEAIQFIARQSQETLGSDMVMVSIPGMNINEVYCDHPERLPFDIKDTPLTSKIGEVILEKFISPGMQPSHIIVNDACDDMQLSHLFDVPVAMLAIPFKLKGSVNGFLSVINFDSKKGFETGDMRLLTSLAEQMSMAITNAELYQNLRDFLLSVIKTLVFSIEAKDSYTKGHSERVSALTMTIAGTMGLSPEEKDALQWAAILHDIGKIGVSEAVLTKPGKLTDEEFLHIKEHPEKGYRILMPIIQLKDSLDGIRHHHERFDGAGYPSGLKGKDIPLYSRIIAVADTYDAMTSKRSYRNKLSYEDSIAEIVRVKGKQLDPDVVDIFIKILEDNRPA